MISNDEFLWGNLMGKSYGEILWGYLMGLSYCDFKWTELGWAGPGWAMLGRAGLARDVMGFQSTVENPHKISP